MEQGRQQAADKRHAEGKCSCPTPLLLAPAHVWLGGDDLVFAVSEAISFVHHVTDSARQIEVVVYPTDTRDMATSSLCCQRGRLESAPSEQGSNVSRVEMT